MDYDNIKKLMDDMGNSKLTSIDIDFPDGTKVSMKKEITQVVTTSSSSSSSKVETQIHEIQQENGETKDNDIKIIKSPMVGTFYLKPSPTSESYVDIGTKIRKGQTVCIVEAMKLMNEIESEFDGEITEIYVKDGETVEYGTPLFGLK